MDIDCNDNDPTINPGSTNALKNCINDIPTLSSFSPNGTNLNFLENTENYFNVSFTDLDSDTIVIEWRVDDNLVWFGNNYKFKKPIGDYIVKVSASDGEKISEHVWNVSVKEIGFFSCQEVNGNLCSSSEICTGGVLSTKDSVCCSVACSEKPPDFKKADACENENSSIKIDFLNINSEKKYKVGEKISFSFKVTNNLEKKETFIVKSYLYDITKERIVEDDEDSVNLNKQESETTKVEFNIPHDLDENDKYSLLITANGNECNKEYVIIDIVRDENDIMIDKFNFMNKIYSCGEYIDAEVGVRNIGVTDEDVYITIKSDFEVSDKTEVFKLGRFNQDDYKKKDFFLKIGDSVKSGSHNIRAEVHFNKDNVASSKKEIILKCDLEENERKDTEIRKSSLEPIKLSSSSSEVGSLSNVPNNKTEENSGVLEILLLLFLVEAILVSIYVVYYFFSQRNFSQKRVGQRHIVQRRVVKKNGKILVY